MTTARKTCTCCQQTLAHDAFGKDGRNKDGRKGICKACENDRLKAWRAANADGLYAAHKAKAAVKAAAYYEANKAVVRAKDRAKKATPEGKAKKSAQDKAYREANKERLKIRAKKWVSANRVHIRRKARERAPKYAVQKAAAVALRRAMKVNATPPWADSKAIQAFYREAKERQKATGIRQHVDHIVPLVSPLVCGLHVQGNLQVLPYVDNHKKSNRWWPDSWDDTVPPILVDQTMLEPETYDDGA